MGEDKMKPAYRAKYKKLIAIIAVIAIVALGVAIPTLIHGSDINIKPLGKLVDPISGQWGVDPGKYVINNWGGESIDLEFALFSENQNDAFFVDGVEYPIGFFEYAFNGSNTEFTVTRLSNGFLQSELLCRIEIETK